MNWYERVLESYNKEIETEDDTLRALSDALLKNNDSDSTSGDVSTVIDMILQYEEKEAVEG